MIGTGIQAYIALGGEGSQITPKEYFLGYMTGADTLQDILDSYNLTVVSGQLPVLSVAAGDNLTGGYIIKKYLTQLTSGGTYAPLGNYASEKTLILVDTLYPNEQTTEAAINAVNAVVLPDFSINSLAELVPHLNESIVPIDVSDIDKIYYFKFNIGVVNYVYVLSSDAVRGIYGEGLLQFTEADLVKFFSGEAGGINDLSLVHKKYANKIVVDNLSGANKIPSNSRFDVNTVLIGNTLGSFNVRTDRNTTAIINEDYSVRLNVNDGINGGLLYPNFFTDGDIGKTMAIEFDVKRVEGILSWRVMIGNEIGTQGVFTVDNTSWEKKRVLVQVGNDQYSDRRLLFYAIGQQTATIDVKNFRLYEVEQFTPVNVDEYDTTLNVLSLPNFKYKAEQLKNGEDVSLVVGIFGDSWTQSVPGSIYYVKNLSRQLRDTYGNGGGGFYDFSRSSVSDFMKSADPDDANDTRSGTITYKDQTADSKGINLAHAEFGTGATLALNVTTAHEKFVIHYFGGAGYGTFRYKIDGGTWATVDATALSGHQTIDFIVSDAVHTVNFEVLTGTVILFGVDMQRTTGIRVHKLGNRGLRASNINLITLSTWRQAVTYLGMDSMTVLLGTNDRTDNRTPLELKTDIKKIVDEARLATPYIDICIIGASENRETKTYSMLQYNTELYYLCKEYKIPFLDLRPLFGERAQIIAKGTFSDNVHPTEYGGNMIARHIYEKLFPIL